MKKLASILFKDYRQKVLGLLLLHPESEYHVREIARLTDTLAGTLHRELKQLSEVGLLNKRYQGNQVLYRANTSNLIFDDLVNILRKIQSDYKAERIEVKSSRVPKMDILVEKNRDKILSLARKNGVRNVRVFGSMARNDADENSDLDLLVELEEGMRSEERRVGKEG